MPAYTDYQTFRVRITGGVARVTLDHPPINLLDDKMVGELDRFTSDVHDDDAVRVVVFESANPDYFIAHYDVQALLTRYTRLPPRAGVLKRFHLLLERLRTVPKITIAQIEGRARGAGSELALSVDLRFAALGRAILGQPEVALGILPGGSGSQRLPRLLGRARALEVIVGAEDADAALAERYGWINRALPAAELAGFVDRLARRIATFSPEAVRLAKRAVDYAELPLHDGLIEEADLFAQLAASPAATERMRGFLAAGGQTVDGERDLAPLLAAVNR